MTAPHDAACDYILALVLRERAGLSPTDPNPNGHRPMRIRHALAQLVCATGSNPVRSGNPYVIDGAVPTGETIRQAILAHPYVSSEPNNITHLADVEVSKAIQWLAKPLELNSVEVHSLFAVALPGSTGRDEDYQETALCLEAPIRILVSNIVPLYHDAIERKKEGLQNGMI